MIFCVQLLFALNIAFVYRVTARVSWRELLHTSGAILLAAYVTIAVWCLFASSKHRLRWYHVWISILLDYALCMEFIFLQHQLAKSSVTSAALFSYVYLFIAVRCLHYRASYVYMAGGFAVLVWVLLLYMSAPQSAQSVIGALKHMTFSKAMLGGLVDKFLSIVAVTTVLAATVSEARRHLYNSAFRGVVGKGLTRMVGSGVAKEVLFSKVAHVVGRGRQEQVAIVMIDIQNFTKLAFKSAPSEVIALLAKYQQLMEPVIVNHGGCIDKFMGDGIMAHFGALEPNQEFAAQALRCVEQIIAAADQWNARRVATNRRPLKIRVSCAVGTAVVGLVGGNSKVEFTIIGDPVNTAAKLEKHAKVLAARALATFSAFDLARRQGYRPLLPVRVVNEVQVPGIEAPLNLVVLGDPVHSQQPSHYTGHGVGRSTETRRRSSF